VRKRGDALKGQVVEGRDGKRIVPGRLACAAEGRTFGTIGTENCRRSEGKKRGKGDQVS